jgi:hypothetical protein
MPENGTDQIAQAIKTLADVNKAEQTSLTVTRATYGEDQMKPDAKKQHQYQSIFGLEEAVAHGDGPYCWNCELTYKSLEDAPPDLPLHFCSPSCRHEWMSQQPLQNLLDKRKAKHERGIKEI